MTFRHPGSDATTNTVFLDALNTTTSGYGTDFRAITASSASATTGTAASVTIPQIVFTYNPRPTISQQGNNLIIAGSGGPSGSPFHLIATTNLSLPLSQWISVASNLFDGSGNFRFTNPAPANLPVRFFRLSVP
jgi:hypothetical protein